MARTDSQAWPAPHRLDALTLDLDDTLWPVAPTIERAEQALQDWLLSHAPATAQSYPIARMRALRAQVALDRPDLGHDLTALRLHTTHMALRDSGDDPALASVAFEVFYAERQRVTYYPEVEAALHRLAARWPLLALSNGNAELQATGLSRWFVGSVSARSAGVAKPDARIFAAACEALRLAPAQVLHVGDDWHCDVLGARAFGMHTAWVQRADPSSAVPGASNHGSAATLPAGPAPAPGLHLSVQNLAALADQLGA